ncbi:hypothetical protein V8E55_008396 [Tylopilus felleus]
MARKRTEWLQSGYLQSNASLEDVASCYSFKLSFREGSHSIGGCQADAGTVAFCMEATEGGDSHQGEVAVKALSEKDRAFLREVWLERLISAAELQGAKVLKTSSLLTVYFRFLVTTETTIRSVDSARASHKVRRNGPNKAWRVQSFNEALAHILT